MAEHSLLAQLKLPEGLKELTLPQQKRLCYEIRRMLVQTVSKNGGHLASNLGVVELTVALHTVFDVPKDQIVWDVGHQCYTHKILTGRLEDFKTIRCEGGISGFPRTAESEYDAFIGGHASNSISAAYGLAKAKMLKGDPNTVVAVVGDGALSGGMIYEALNNAGRSKERLIVVLNDNDMSISKSVGAFARYLAQKRSSEGYLHLKSRVEDTILKIPVVGQNVRDAMVSSKAAFRQFLYHSNLFEDFGFRYLGPVDGHDIAALTRVLHYASKQEGPILVHVNTVKGKGYAFAEKNPSAFHGIGSFNEKNGMQTSKAGDTFSSMFGDYLIELAKKDDRICAVTAAMEAGTGLSAFAQAFEAQGRYFDVGIAEEHAVTFCCGLAAGGMLPVFAVYSTFLQRCFDQLLHDGAIEPRHIVLAIDRAGIVEGDGETHQGLLDTAFLSIIPGSALYAPATFQELQWSLDQAFYHENGIAAIRYPKGGQLNLEPPQDGKIEEYVFTYAQKEKHADFLFVSYGRETAQVYEAQTSLNVQGMQADVLKLTKIWPIPQAALEAAKGYTKVLFAEEGSRRAGIGEAFLSELRCMGYQGKGWVCGVENPFLPAMKYISALKQCGLDAHSLADLAYEQFREDVS